MRTGFSEFLPFAFYGENIAVYLRESISLLQAILSYVTKLKTFNRFLSYHIPFTESMMGKEMCKYQRNII